MKKALFILTFIIILSGCNTAESGVREFKKTEEPKVRVATQEVNDESAIKKETSTEESEISIIKSYYTALEENELKKAYEMKIDNKVSFLTFSDWYKDVKKANAFDFNILEENKYEFKVELMEKNQEIKFYNVVMKVENGKLKTISSKEEILEENQLQDTKIKEKIDNKKNKEITNEEDIDISHLNKKAQSIVNEWKSIKLDDFQCNKLSENKVSFVFVPMGYKNLKSNNESKIDFEFYSKYFVWATNQEEPFSSYSNINEYYIYRDQLNEDEGDDAYATAKKMTKKIIESCGNSARPLFVYIEKKKEGSLAGGMASIEEGFIIMTNDGYKKMIESSNTPQITYHQTPPHEVGHAFAGFLDEYFHGEPKKIWPSESNEYIDANGIKNKFQETKTPFNKGRDVPSCTSLSQAKVFWQDLINSELNKNEPKEMQIGYHEGCGPYKNRYTSSRISMMGTGDEFDLVQKRFLCELLVEITSERIGYCKNF